MNAARRLLISSHGVTWPNRSCEIALAAIAAIVASSTAFAQPEEPASPAPDPRVTPSQIIDGWTGLPIPCRCRYRGQTYRLGDVVCMNTHLGTVLTRCELFLNNTSWMPTRKPCTISELPAKRADARLTAAGQ